MKLEWKRLKWAKNENWFGPGCHLYYEIDTKNKLIIDIMCRFSNNDKVEGFRSEVIVYIGGESYIENIYDVDLDVIKLKSLIIAKELGWDIDNIV